MISELKNVNVLKKRNICYDIMRLIAIFMVLYNHRILYSFFLDTNNSFVKIVLQILAVFSRCGPPLFFMISGALLLGKKEKVIDIIKHRVIRIFVVMFVITIYAFYSWNSGNSFITLYFTGLNWYLYAYIAYLLMLPLLRGMVTNLTESQMKYLIVCSMIFYSLSGILIVLGFNERFLTNLTLFNSAWGSNCWHILFPCLGYIWITIINEKNEKKYEGLLAIGTIITLVVTCLLLWYDAVNHDSVNVEQILQHATLIPCSFVFVFIYNHFKRIDVSEKVTKVFSTISGTIFGVFLVETHSSVSANIYEHISGIIPNMYISTFASILCSFLVISFAIFLLRLIPGVKKIL